MASVSKRVSKAGKATYAVLYRHGTRQTSKTFTTKKSADRLCLLITTLGPDQGLARFAEEQPGRSRSATVDDLAAQWLAMKRRDLTPRAHADYARDYDNWVRPSLGHREAAFLTEHDVQTWVDVELASLSAKTVADRHALLHGILGWAAAKKRGLIPHNPCLETELPKRTKKPAKGLTLVEWLALRDAAYRVNEESADLILFMASTGWRIGEAVALTVANVDTSGARTYVTVSQVSRKGEGLVQGAKSEAGERRLSVLPDAARMLDRRLVGKAHNDLVFTNSHSPLGLWEPSTFRNRWWAKTVKEAGLELRKPTPHWLRHTHVMLCHSAGMSLPEIQRRIGHADIKTTMNVYGRMIDGMPDDVAERLDAMLSGNLPIVGEVVASPPNLTS